ncbi:hypothetical protein BVC80_881g12 [Macleaya cordata]|uniref:Uncharacterized protein n=1 Tax=Macleaya cordata TaxID=56857 RepID=A0A200RD67_MACCD|nr:hypothetical protein BVC80_6123g2 [Macleaya cordata]OVA20665.1 hypothetical protein BVC80_881g12 [Macleaya cordata]
MAEKREEETPAISTPDFGEKSDSRKDPADFQTEEVEEKPAGGKEPDTVREPKRRRKCPAALEKFEEFETSNRSFSFSFDTKITSGGHTESTPKFGSFNLVGELGLLGTITSTTQEEEEDCDDQISLGFAENNNEEQEEVEEKGQTKSEIENSIPIVVRTAD